MANKFYVPGEERAARVSDLFASIATRYDLLNDFMSFGLHRRWKRRVIALAAPAPGMRALDLCCGTGDLAFALAARGAEVTGLDFSEAMLAVAAQRNEKTDAAHRPKFLRGDALALPFPDASFDLVTIGYGLRNLADCAGGLREMRRVLRPGGRLLVLDFGKPPNPLWRRMYFAHLKYITPLPGRLMGKEIATYAYIYESLQHYPAQTGVAQILGELGFAEVQVINLLGGIMSIHNARREG
ncbi:MAG TPA: bifunctional demethylmenaquinone methyltransferase/2-methoxy-6-polyprenyl-1,4-benzoquinol methylase UbiE [Dongiaceae bacterium]|nr:bifunctional demethylmenaquinone methyltransferase/2-methoxy-6-polyprenyl-1,4-benzoquinol methylase UbiE [Dongiaceae bacterium]